MIDGVSGRLILMGRNKAKMDKNYNESYDNHTGLC